MKRHTCLALLLLLLGASRSSGQTLCNDSLCSDCDAQRIECVKCENGHSLDSLGFCSPCKDPLCDACSGPDGTTCTACKNVDYAAPGDDLQPLVYLDAISGTCKHCPGHVVRGPTNCIACGGDGKCSTCMTGYYLDDNKECQSCSDPLCKNCTATACLECQETYYDPDSFDEFPDWPVYMDENGVCRNCTHTFDEACEACNSQGQCTSCDASAGRGGHTLDPETGSCVRCEDELCGRCDVKDPSKCYECLEESWTAWDGGHPGPIYMNATGGCNECAHTRWDGCTRCDSNGDCVECESPGSSFLSDGKCAPCDAVIDHCNTCDATGSNCLQCEEGFGLEGNSTCVECFEAMPNCATCTTLDACLRCDEGYYLDNRSQCQKSPEGCERTRPDGTCDTCKDGYQLEGAACVEGTS